MQLLTATVKYAAGKVFATDYGDRVNAVLTLGNGQEIKLWGNPHSPVHALKKGQTCQVIYDRTKDVYKLLEPETQDEPTAPAQASEPPQEPKPAGRWSADRKRAIAAEVENLTDCYAFCFDQVVAKMGDRLGADDIRQVATTVFLQALRTEKH